MAQKGSHYILLVGTGDMAVEHARTLRHLGVEAERIRVVGNTLAKVEEFNSRTGLSAVPGGLAALESEPEVDRAIVAVSHTKLPDVARTLIRKKCRWILLEKPGALYQAELETMEREASRSDSAVFVAFNRRFFPSVEKARQIIEDDGGLLSCFFDFTEVERLVLFEKDAKNLPDEVLQRWGIVNSLHVIDLFFHLSGLPQSLSGRQAGSLAWHRRAARFCGSGVTEKGVLFAYLSTWDGAGRWGVELTTPLHKMVLRPLETLVWQEKGKFQLEKVQVSNGPEGLKPGFCEQSRAFLEAVSGRPSPLCSLREAIRHFAVAQEILGY